ncbi:MAG: TetR/AcrR family transcriptional regulator [Vicinamibacterales bacterium]
MPPRRPNRPSAEHADARTRLLDAALKVVRTKGYSATRVEDICAEAGLSKGAFFHHFDSKEHLAVEAAGYWSEVTDAFFAAAPYRHPADPLDRVFGYIDFRRRLLVGALPEFTCLVGTMVQETYHSHPAIRDACDRSITGHASDVARDIELAKQQYVPDADWSAESLALHTQAVLQGAFILAKARNDRRIAEESVDHLRRYLEMLFNRPSPEHP